MKKLQLISKLQKLCEVIESWRRTNKIEKLYLKEKWYDCIADCYKAINSGKIDFFVCYYLGLSKFQINLIDESTKMLKQALDMPLSNIMKKSTKEYRCYAKYHLAVNFRKQGEYLKALEQLNKNIEEETNYMGYYHLKANIYEDLEDIELAIKAMSDGLRINPKHKGLRELQKYLAYAYSREQSNKRNGG